MSPARRTPVVAAAPSALTGVSVVPALTAPVRPRTLSVSETVLDSGLRVMAVRRPGVPLVEIRLRVPMISGRPAQAAQADLLGETLLGGTRRLDRGALAEAIASLGADLSVGVDADRLSIGGSVLATNLPALLRLLSEILTEAAHAKSEVDGERARMLERLSIARSQAGVVARAALAHRMYGTHPYGLDLPDEADVAAATPAQIRSLHSRLIRPGGAVLVLVGDVSPSRAFAAAGQALQGWAGTSRSTRMPQLPPIETAPLLLVDRPGSVQSCLRMGASALTRLDPGYPALQLANMIFGGYFSSRWNENIREDKGYTYGPHSRIDHGALGSSLQLDADVATDVTGPALLETLYELGRISSLPVTEAELEAVRQYAIGTLALSTATQAGLASTLSGLIGVGVGPDWLSEHPRRLAKVTVEQVSAAAATYFAPSRFVSVVVGDGATVRTPLERIIEVERSSS
jgi:zinc protease